jgi:periplasmic divalent cation tolerance protein
MAPGGSDTEIVMVLTVVDDREVAGRLAESAVAEHLAACAQLEGPLRSTYRWEGELCSDEEWRVVAKVTAAGASALVAHWAAEHPYEVPEVLVVPVLGGHAPYLSWVGSEVRSEPL